MFRKDFQNLARMRIREAKTLLDAGQFPGAYYLAGFAVECAIKACIAKRTKKYEFPNKQGPNVWIHDIPTLAGIAGIQSLINKEAAANKTFDQNWATVKDWKVERRYGLPSLPTQKEAEDLYEAIANRSDGVLKWLRQHW